MSDPSSSAAVLPRQVSMPSLPGHVAQAVWRAHELAGGETAGWSTGFSTLDAELPGAGWPRQGLVEVLQAPGHRCEWRLLGPVLPALAQQGPLMLVEPPLGIHAAALAQLGLAPQRVMQIRAPAHAQRLWVAEQLAKACAGAVLAWLPHARSDQLRRLQLHAQAAGVPLFLFRPLACRHDASPAPLRLSVAPQGLWQLSVRVTKRRGAAHEQALSLHALPAALSAVLPDRLLNEDRITASSSVAAPSPDRASDRNPQAAPALPTVSSSVAAISNRQTDPGVAHGCG